MSVFPKRAVRVFPGGSRSTNMAIRCCTANGRHFLVWFDRLYRGIFRLGKLKSGPDMYNAHRLLIDRACRIIVLHVEQGRSIATRPNWPAGWIGCAHVRRGRGAVFVPQDVLGAHSCLAFSSCVCVRGDRRPGRTLDLYD